MVKFCVKCGGDFEGIGEVCEKCKNGGRPNASAPHSSADSSAVSMLAVPMSGIDLQYSSQLQDKLEKWGSIINALGVLAFFALIVIGVINGYSAGKTAASLSSIASYQKGSSFDIKVFFTTFAVYLAFAIAVLIYNIVIDLILKAQAESLRHRVYVKKG